MLVTERLSQKLRIMKSEKGFGIVIMKNRNAWKNVCSTKINEKKTMLKKIE